MVVIYHFKNLLVGIVPGCFVVREDADMKLPGECGDAFSVFYGGGQWFFHHDGDAFWCADLYDAEVFGDGIVCEYGVGVGMFDEFGEAGVKK